MRLTPFPALLAVALFATPVVAQSFGSGARLIRSGDMLDGTLTPSDPTLDDGSHYDLYRYDGTPGETVVLTLRSSDFDAYLIGGALGPDGLEDVLTDDDGAGGTDAQLTFEIGPSGRAAFQANSLSAGATGRYTIYAESIGGGQPADDVVRAGQTVQGQLSTDDLMLDDGSYFDLYTIAGAPGEDLVVTLRSSDFDAYLSGGPFVDGEVMIENNDDDGAGGTDAQLLITVGDDGTYGVRANSLSGGSTGAYALSVESLSGPAPGPSGNATPIAAGAPVRGTLDATDATLSDGSSYDLYEFEGQPGQDIEVFLASAEFDTFLLGGPTESDAFGGTDTDDDGGGGTNSQLRVTLGSTGRYTIIANAFSPDASGEYLLTVRALGGGDAGLDGLATIRMGETVAGRLDASDPTLDDGSHFDFYAYAGTPGEDVVITLTSTDFDPYMMLNRVFGGELESVANDDDSGPGTNARIRATLSQSGTYVIVANSFARGATGAYTLAVERPDAVADDTDTSLPALVTGVATSGSLAPTDATLADSSYADLYVYRGTPGDNIEVTLRSTAFDAYLSIGTVEGDDVTIVGRDDDGGGGTDARVRFTVGPSGVYAVQANSYGPGETGPYTLLAERLGTGATPAPAPQSRFAGKWAPVTYDPTTDFADVRSTVRQRRHLETVVAELNEAYPLPRNVSVTFEECGQPNAFYSPRDAAVSFCYEMMTYMTQVLGAQVEAERLAEAVDGAYRFIMLHEVGHALTHQLDLPITGREEDVADQFATLALIREGDKGAAAAIDGVLALQGRSEFGASDYADEHSLGPQRLYNVACWVFGSDPDKYMWLVNDDGGLPVARARRCAGEFAQMEKSFDRLLDLVYNE